MDIDLDIREDAPTLCIYIRLLMSIYLLQDKDQYLEAYVCIYGYRSGYSGAYVLSMDIREHTSSIWL